MQLKLWHTLGSTKLKMRWCSNRQAHGIFLILIVIQSNLVGFASVSIKNIILITKFNTKGYVQTYDDDYLKMFSPIESYFFFVCIFLSMWNRLACSTTWCWKCFPNDGLIEKYKCSNLLAIAAKSTSTGVCKLPKIVYSFKRSPKAWFHKLNNIISKVGITCKSLQICYKGTRLWQLSTICFHENTPFGNHEVGIWATKHHRRGSRKNYGTF